jgi:hypothetical protein
MPHLPTTTFLLTLIIASYSSSLPNINSIKPVPAKKTHNTNNNQVDPISFDDYTTSHVSICSGLPDKPCHIIDSVNVQVRKSIEVQSLFIDGTLDIYANKDTSIVVKTAFILVNGPSATLNVTATEQKSSVTIYLRRNPAAYKDPPFDSHTKENSIKLYNDAQNLLGGGRFLCGYKGGKVFIKGRPIKNTFSILVEDVMESAKEIFVQHDIMDWEVGSEIAIAMTDQAFSIGENYNGLDGRVLRPDAQTNSIKSIHKISNKRYQIVLDKEIQPRKDKQLWQSEAQMENVPVFLGRPNMLVQAEVLNLQRSVLITGDDFSKQYKNRDTSIPFYDSDFAGEGLHTIQWGSAAQDGKTYDGGIMQINYTRIEKAGQRGWKGRYPLHLHYMGKCGNNCQLIGNAVVDTQQRGITIHGTHLSLVSKNILYHARGAGIYVEEGICLNNTISYNVNLCPVGLSSETFWDSGANRWITGAGCHTDYGDPSLKQGGCRICGTDNFQADSYQQSGLWALSATNDFLHNRFINHYNCFYTQTTLFSRGRSDTPSFGKVCPMGSPFGKIVGTVCHSCQRFGMYPDSNFPVQLKRDYESGGRVSDLTDQCPLHPADPKTWCSCRRTTITGEDNGQDISYISDSIDYGSAFVGQYDLTDVQYVRHTSFNNDNNFYEKGTKAMKNVGYAHVNYSTYAHYRKKPFGSMPGLPLFYSQGDDAGLLQLPGSSAALLISNVVLKGFAKRASWISTPQTAWAEGAAIGLNQQSKPFYDDCIADIRNCITGEGALGSGTAVLTNVSFTELWEDPDTQDESSQPAWIKYGVHIGNNQTGIVFATDNSLCGGKIKDKKCLFVSLTPGKNKYLTAPIYKKGKRGCWALQKSPAYKEDPYNGIKWWRRFQGSIACDIPLRRFDVWGERQDVGVDLLLTAPGQSKDNAFRMRFISYVETACPAKPTDPCKVLCVGTKCVADQYKSYGQGYTAPVVPLEHVERSDLPWILERSDGKAIDLNKIWMIEFSDPLFAMKGIETLKVSWTSLQFNRQTCTFRNTDRRTWITANGPVKKWDNKDLCPPPS